MLSRAARPRRARWNGAPAAGCTSCCTRASAQTSGCGGTCRLRVPDQRAGTVIDLRLFAGWSLDEDASLGSVLLQPVNKAANALVATLKPVLIHQVLPDRHRVASVLQ